MNGEDACQDEVDKMPRQLDTRVSSWDTMTDAKDEKPEAGSEDQGDAIPSSIYRNSLLYAVGYLDLTNALDFPANVWNQVPIPLYAQVLMGLGGSIAILATSFAFWDMARCKRNINFVLRERACLHKRSTDKGLNFVEKAWISINTRELCWEVIDRFLLDLFMAISGILVGIGCLLAIRGDDPTIFQVSNYLSGYVGNSFVAFYALINSFWSIILWRRAHKNQKAVARVQANLDQGLAKLMRRHARKHQLYATINGVSILVSGVASEVSATKWQGYVVLIPCIVGSIFCNHYWRSCLGYDRLSFQSRRDAGEMDLGGRLRAVVDIRTALAGQQTREMTFLDSIAPPGEPSSALGIFFHDLGLDRDLQSRLKAVGTITGPETIHQLSAAVSDCIHAAGLRRFRYEERFLLELYGYYLREKELARIDTES